MIYTLPRLSFLSCSLKFIVYALSCWNNDCSTVAENTPNLKIISTKDWTKVSYLVTSKCHGKLSEADVSGVSSSSFSLDDELMAKRQPHFASQGG